MRRAALSVVANIAEGYIRATRQDRLHFYNIALGSLVELECFIEFSKDVNYLSRVDYQSLIVLQNETLYLLKGFMKSQRS